jgi:hypothetical protein
MQRTNDKWVRRYRVHHLIGVEEAQYMDRREWMQRGAMNFALGAIEWIIEIAQL